MTLLEALEDLPRALEAGEVFKFAGVCWYLDGRGVRCWEFTDIAKRWPKYSGFSNYPVPGWKRGQDPDDAFHDVNPEQRWSRKHPCGKLRWELVEFVIAELKKETA